MSKTTDLRGLVTRQLNTLPGMTYHLRAPDDAIYPYKVYSVTRIELGDLSRDDYDVCVDVWDRSENWKRIEGIADDIGDLFNAANQPQDTILPTFFRASSYPVEDPDKELQHYQLHFTVQLYTT